ncbi:phage replisome organizer N-terminal domain-containing protein [Bacillus cereus group sp. BfR-BA-01380]|uniref:phage replisome organizer N-terminal domain-containing protein n=1 Tax=Bacillus cereus group sp. BfR-BA-01380 TaxID=2920324 RepID=UPI001F59FA08|nr:phage replisome organizer N-terminal domain-containing protein [Bacillus cereus group sp. BfR-BA-01380]
MSEVKVKWIKLSTTMFEDEKIRLIESMPEADTLLIIWIKLLAQAGKINASGYVFLNENIPYTEEMLSTLFNRPLNTVRMALNTFKQFGMIDIDENHYINITNWGKHQSLDRLDEIKEQNRERKRRQREREKQARLNSPQECHVTGHEEVTDKEEDKDLDIDKDLEEDIKKEYSPEGNQDISSKTSIPYEEIVSYLNHKAGKSYKDKTDKTRSLIKARFKDGFTLEDFKYVIDVKTSQWLNDFNMNPYLRPETLFGNKFEGYLNEKPIQQKRAFKGGSNNGSSQQSNDQDFEYIGL